MKTLKILIFGWLLLITHFLASGQKYSNQTFITGYYGGLPTDSIYVNNVFITRSDTGLTFSSRIHSEYDFNNTQNSILCDESGIPLLVWQGCFLLDANTMSPIHNGEFNKGPGTEATDKFPTPYCSIIKKGFDDGPGVVSRYLYPWSTFILDIGDPRNILLVYYRNFNLPWGDTCYIYTAKIDMIGSPTGGPTVVYKDSLAAGKINIKYGSINAVRHGNGKNWFVTFTQYHSKKWYSMLFDDVGLHEPVESEIEEMEVDSLIDGMTAFSPDGLKYSIHHFTGFLILNFDRCEGKFSFRNQGNIPYLYGTGIWRFQEFSPNSRFVYLSNLYKIYQYDLEAQDFEGSRTMVAVLDTVLAPGAEWFGGLSTPFRGYDGSIYYWTTNGIRIICKMAKPDQKGPDVGWIQNYYRLPIYQPWFAPTFIDYTTPALAEPCILSNKNILDFKIQFNPNPTTGYIKGVFPDEYNYNIVKIVDLTGNVVWSGRAIQLKVGIYLHDLNSGIYNVFMNGVYTGRFVKLSN